MSYCDSTISSTLIIYDLFMFGKMYSVVSYFWCHEDFHKGVHLPPSRDSQTAEHRMQHVIPSRNCERRVSSQY